MAGVLPFYFDEKKKQIYYIIARESHTHPNAANEFSDFGGAKEANESKLDTAARECYEESMGFFGNHQHIKKKISHLPEYMRPSIKSYTTYLMFTREGQYMSSIMNSHFNFAKEKFSEVIDDDTNCIYEKDYFISATLEELKNKHSSNIRRFYRGIIDNIDETKIYNYIFQGDCS